MFVEFDYWQDIDCDGDGVLEDFLLGKIIVQWIVIQKDGETVKDGEATTEVTEEATKEVATEATTEGTEAPKTEAADAAKDVPAPAPPADSPDKPTK